MKKLSSTSFFWVILCMLFISGNVLEGAEFPLKATYKVDAFWATAYQTTITIQNTTNAPTTSWTAKFTLPQGYSLSSNFTPGPGVVKIEGQNVTVMNPVGKGVIPAGGSVSFAMMIVMPRSSPTTLVNLIAMGNGSGTPAPAIPVAPLLNPIQSSSNQSYTVSWNSVENATYYVLQQSVTSQFSNPQIVAQGNLLSKTFTNQLPGVYYYRALASNSMGNSPYSNIQSITVSETPIPTPTKGIEHSAWYIDWTAWLTGPTFILPKGNDMLNVFVGTLKFGEDGKPTLGGFGTFTSESLKAFTAYCAAQQPPILVKVSIGGAGGMYDRCWDLLNEQNVDAFAQGMVDYCHDHGLAGIDFDYEHYTSVEQENLVGRLIKKFKLLDPKMQTSLCTNAGFGPFMPWPAIVKVTMDAALISPGNCAIDRLYIMSYYDPIESEKAWIMGWSDWAIANYGFTRSRISVGIDDFDFHAYDPIEFANWAASMGFSTAHWAFDPAHPQ